MKGLGRFRCSSRKSWPSGYSLALWSLLSGALDAGAFSGNDKEAVGFCEVPMFVTYGLVGALAVLLFLSVVGSLSNINGRPLR